MAGLLGKVAITLALVAQAYLLFSEPTLIKHFDKNLKALDAHELLKQTPPVVQVYLHQAFQQALFFRYTVVGLLGSTVLVLLTGSSYLAVFPILGVLLQTLVVCNPLLEKDQLTLVNFLKNLAVVGALLVYSNFLCKSCRSKKVKTQ